LVLLRRDLRKWVAYDRLRRTLERLIVEVGIMSKGRIFFEGNPWPEGHPVKEFRPTPDGWVRAYWPEEVIALLEAGGVTEVSLDHDLGNDAKGTGYDDTAAALMQARCAGSRSMQPEFVLRDDGDA
jgi:hypothetical protein